MGKAPLVCLLLLLSQPRNERGLEPMKEKWLPSSGTLGSTAPAHRHMEEAIVVLGLHCPVRGSSADDTGELVGLYHLATPLRP